MGSFPVKIAQMPITPSISTQKVNLFQVSEDQAGQRIDNFLLAQLKGVPRSKIYNILRRGEVRVNKGRIKPQYRIQVGDKIRIPPIRMSEKSTQQPSGRVLQQIRDAIIYEDDQLLVLNKPSGLAVHGGSGVKFGIIEALRALRGEHDFLELVHRLDRDTSGCLLVAKKRAMLKHLHTQFRDTDMHKRYLALLRGHAKNKHYDVDLKLKKNTLASGQRIVRVNAEGKSALSHFKPIVCRKPASLYEVTIKTGRTHQIRVHAQGIGHPVAGDEKYGDDEFNRQMKKYGLKRMFLHAFKITVKLPDNNRLELSAPLSDELITVLNNLDIDTHEI